MINQNVQIVRCEDERIWVRIGSQSGCSACENGRGCGAGLFAKLLHRKPVVLELPRNDMNVESGQMLTLAFPEQAYLKLVLASYGWPLLAALAGAFVGHGLFKSLHFGPAMIDVATFFGGLLAAVFVMRFIKNRYSTDVILSSLNTMVCYPSITPRMCSGAEDEIS